MQKPPSSIENDRAHYAHLKTLQSPDQWAIKYLYDRLGILDNKTSALLRFNGVAMGFLAVLSLRTDLDSAVDYPKLFLAVTFVSFAILGLAEFAAFRIFALRFDRITAGRSQHEYEEAFFEITCEREELYQKALWLSRIGACCFMILVLAAIAQKISKLGGLNLGWP